MNLGAPGTGRPLVTVVMAAHDAERHVGAALASLVNQTVPDLEVLVVDDGSTDGTTAIVAGVARRDPRLRLVRMERNRGQAAALNAGIRLARGRYLAILDADDEATPDRLALQLRAFERDPDLVLVGGSVVTWCDRYATAGHVWHYATGDDAIRARTLFKSEFISGAMTLDLDRLGRDRAHLDETLRVGGDWALSIEAMTAGRVANVPEVIMRYRVHPGQLTAGMRDDLDSDGARIRARLLARLGLRVTDDDLRTHLAVSPCNYWPVGAHPYFRARGPAIAGDARGWFERLAAANARARHVRGDVLEAYLEGILSGIARHLEEPDDGRDDDARSCPVAHPRRCVAHAACR